MNTDVFKIIYKDKAIDINKNSYESLLKKTIERLYKSEEKNNLFISIEKEESMPFMLVYYTLLKYKDNLLNPDNDIVKHLKKNSFVNYNNCRYQYIEQEELTMKQLDNTYEKCSIYILKTNNGYEKVRENDRYKMTLYDGSANKINSFPDQEKVLIFKKNELVFKRLISDIFNIDIKNLSGYAKEKILIVHENKQQLDQIIRNLKIEYKGDIHLFSSLFSTAYYSNKENSFFYKREYEKNEPILFCTTRLDVAEYIVSKNKNVKDIIFIGGNLIKDRAEGVIRRICKKKSLNKAIIMDEWSSNLNFNEVLNSDLEFNIYAYSKNVLLDNVICSTKELSTESSIADVNKLKLKNFVYSEFKFYSIKRDKVTEKFEKLLKKIKYLKINDDVKNGLFAIEVYGLMKRFKSVCVPLKELDEISKSIDNKIDNLLGLIYDHNLQDDFYVDIVELLIEIQDYYTYNNKKFDVLKDLISQNSSIKIVSKFEEEAKYLSEKFKVHASVSMDLNDLNYDNFYILYYNENFINKIYSSNFLSKNIFVHKLDSWKYSKFIKEKTEELTNLSKRNLLDEDSLDKDNLIETVEISEGNIDEEINNNKETEILNDIEEYEDKSILKDLVLKNIDTIIKETNRSEGSQNSEIDVKKSIIFNDYYALLSQNYTADVIDFEKGTLKETGINNLNIGDKLVFAKFGKSVVDVFLNLLISDKKLSDTEIKDVNLNDLWKNKLLQYKKNHNFNYKELSKNLNIPVQNLYSWIEGDIVAPRDNAKLTKICETLNISNIEEVVEAAKHTRKIRTYLKKIAEKIITNSVLSNDDKKDELVEYLENKIGSLDEYVQILEIQNIEDCNITISTKNANIPLVLLED